MLLSGEAERLQKMEGLIDALGEWNGAVSELHRLGGNQLDTLSGRSETELSDILAQKDQVYRTAQELSQRVVALEQELPKREASAEAVGTLAEQWQEIGRLRKEILATLTELAKIESRSQELVREHMRRIQSELEGMHRNRNLAGAYGAKGERTPRFLDQLR